MITSTKQTPAKLIKRLLSINFANIQLQGMEKIVKVLRTHDEPWKHYEGVFDGVTREENYNASIFRLSTFENTWTVRNSKNHCAAVSTL